MGEGGLLFCFIVFINLKSLESFRQRDTEIDLGRMNVLLVRRDLQSSRDPCFIAVTYLALGSSMCQLFVLTYRVGETGLCPRPF